jgi:hypothetical protein
MKKGAGGGGGGGGSFKSPGEVKEGCAPRVSQLPLTHLDQECASPPQSPPNAACGTHRSAYSQETRTTILTMSRVSKVPLASHHLRNCRLPPRDTFCRPPRWRWHRQGIVVHEPQRMCQSGFLDCLGPNPSGACMSRRVAAKRSPQVAPNGKQILSNVSLGMYLGAKIGILGGNGGEPSPLLRRAPLVGGPRQTLLCFTRCWHWQSGNVTA